MQKSVFRKVSLDRLASPDQLDQLMTVTNLRGWLAVLGMALVILAAVVWGIYGTVTTQVNAQGMLMRSGGVRNIVHIADGQLIDVKIQPGDIVKSGDIIARMTHPELIAEINHKQRQLDEATPNIKQSLQTAIETLRKELEYKSYITTPFAGRVLEVVKGKGDIVLTNETIASIEPVGDAIADLQAVIFVPLEHGKKVHPGMEVKVSPSTVRKEEYGFILGRISSVSEFPTTRQGMLNVLGNQEMVDKMIGEGAPVSVKIELIRDPDTISGFKWSSTKGPPVMIDSGTFCEAEIIVDEFAPYKLVFPSR